jgi:hypothetical protein
VGDESFDDATASTFGNTMKPVGAEFEAPTFRKKREPWGTLTLLRPQGKR